MKHLSPGAVILCAFFSAFLLLSVPAAAQTPAFQKTNTYASFSDVSARNWYCDNVRSVCEYGLMNGKGDSLFVPDGHVTYAEGITLASRLHKITHEGNSDFPQSSPWYQSYVDYANEHNMRIIYMVPLYMQYSGYFSEYIEYFSMDSAMPRYLFAKLICRALPDEILEEINTIETGAIPDISLYEQDSEVRESVYRLYRAGIITGKNAAGAFDPFSPLTRAETAAILSRVVDPALRQKITLKAPEENGSLTMGKVRRLVRGLNVGEITSISLEDYDMDGKKEAFVITKGEPRSNPLSDMYAGSEVGCVLFVTNVRADILCCAPYEIPVNEDRLYDDFGAFKIYWFIGDSLMRNRLEASGLIMWRVRDGIPEQFELPNYKVLADELFPGVEPYMMFPIGSMWGPRKPEYLPDQKAYLIETGQVIENKSEKGSGAPFVSAELLFEVNEETLELEWTKRRVAVDEGGYYDYQEAQAYIDKVGTDGWIPSPEKKVQTETVDW